MRFARVYIQLLKSNILNVTNQALTTILFHKIAEAAAVKLQ